MKKLILTIMFIFFATIAIITCTKQDKDNNVVPLSISPREDPRVAYDIEDDDIEDIIKSPYIAGLTTNNYPEVDGSTSTEPLNIIIACKLFDIDYEWLYLGQKVILPKTEVYHNKLWYSIKSTQTHNSFINLIDKKADITLSARKMSPDEKSYAEKNGVRLIETPIALDAFIIIVNPENKIQSLTTIQIQDIYTGKITDWNEVGGGYSKPIQPYVRNPNSGSQELMELLVMKDLDIAGFPYNEEAAITSMVLTLDRVAEEIYSICYTVYYYLEYQSTSKSKVKPIAVNGIYPNAATIGDRSYPYTTEVYAVIRSDMDESSMAYKIYEWLQTEAGRQVIKESGYILN